MLKPINGFPEYSITEDGKVWSNHTKTYRKLYKNVDGYNCVGLSKNGKGYHKRVCRLVAEHYVDNPNNKPVVNHKNLVRDDDYFENLEWCTTLENNLHGIENNREAHRGNAVITEDDAHEICKLIQAGLRSKDIVDILKVPLAVVDAISKYSTWKPISKEYNFPPKGTRVSKLTAKWIKHQLDLGLSYQEVVEISTNKRVTVKLIELLDNNLIYKELS